MSLAPSPERLHGLDAVRGFALLLGVALHACMSWLPGAQYFWIASDADPSLALSGLFFWIHSFRMLLFFVLAGYFGRLALDRLGTAAFVRDRFRRIVVPLLSAWPLVFTAIIVVIVWGAWLKNGGALPKESPPGPKFTPDDFPLTHLWFLYVLSLFYTAMLALRALFARLDRGGHVQQGLDGVMRGLLGWAAPALLAVPVALSLWLTPKWMMWFGVPTPDQSLYPNPAALTAYGIAFAAGWALHRQAPLMQALRQRWPLYLAIAVASTVACLAITGVAPQLAPAAQDAPTLGFAIVFALSGWSWTFALIGLALRFCATHSPARRYLADASYWIYLVHLPLVMAGQVAATQFDAPWWIEFPLMLATALALMLASYQWFVRYSFIGATLNGRRVPRDVAAPIPAAAAAVGTVGLQ